MRATCAAALALATLVVTAAAAGGAERAATPVPGAAGEVALLGPRAAGADAVASLPIDLATALALAAAKNLDIREARARVAEARGIHDEALGRFVPEYRGSFTAAHIDGEIQASFGDLERHSFSTLLPATGIAIGLNPAGAIFDALATHRSLGAAEHEAEQASQGALASAARQYFELQQAEAEVRIAEEALAEAREFARVARERESLGVGLQIDVLRAEARIAEQDVRLARSVSARREASVRLSLTLEIDPTVALFPIETVVRERTLVDPDLQLDALTARAMASRPELAGQERRLAAAEDSHAAAWAGAVGPTIWGSFEESAIGTRIDELGNRQIYGGFVGFRFSVASIGRVEAAGARVDQARIQQQRLEQQIAAEVVVARERASAAKQELEAAMHGLDAASQAQELAQVRFAGGVGIGLDVLAAQRTLAEARTHIVSAIVSYDTAEVSLLQAVGGVSVPALLRQSAVEELARR